MIHNLQKSSRIGKIHRVSFCGSRCFMCFTTKKAFAALAKRCRLASVFAAPRMHQEIFPTSSSSFACFGMWYLQRKAHILFHQGVLHSTCLVQGGRQKSKAYHFSRTWVPDVLSNSPQPLAFPVSRCGKIRPCTLPTSHQVREIARESWSVASSAKTSWSKQRVQEQAWASNQCKSKLKRSIRWKRKLERSMECKS